jgi:prepilin-type processing-associated H-X9-DG protein
VLVTGEGTAWADGRSPRLSDFTDGTSETIMVVEIANSNIHWMEPQDLTIDQAMRGINSPAGMCISAWHPVDSWRNRPESANVAFADGSIVNLENDLPLDELRKLLTCQGGEKVKRPEDEL